MKGEGSNVRCFTHTGDPTKDIGIKADVVLRNVYAALNEDLSLQGAAIVWIRNEQIVERQTLRVDAPSIK